MITEAEEIELALTGHRHFEECLLAEVGWRHYGTTIDFTFNDIWEGDRIRPEILERPRLVTVRAYLVQELKLANAITEAMAREPESLDWGFSEVAMVGLVADSPLLEPYRRSGTTYHHLAILWEGDRRIDVIFHGLDISA
ncbi:hypothetical protein ACWDA3_51915 [Nonomuraea rubra]